MDEKDSLSSVFNQCFFTVDTEKLYNFEEEMINKFLEYNSFIRDTSFDFDSFVSMQYMNQIPQFNTNCFMEAEILDYGTTRCNVENPCQPEKLSFCSESTTHDHKIQNVDEQLIKTNISQETILNCNKKAKFTVVYDLKLQNEENKFPEDFKFKFVKRENIDKKILRMFRRFLKEKDKHNKIQGILKGKDIIFWSNFIYCNLLPPMTYVENDKKFEFKSFNTKYMQWLFSHKDADMLYRSFYDQQEKFIQYSLVKKLKIKKQTDQIRLIQYIQHMGQLFSGTIDIHNIIYNHSINNLAPNDLSSHTASEQKDLTLDDTESVVVNETVTTNKTIKKYEVMLDDEKSIEIM